jgi:hypothetical protein
VCTEGREYLRLRTRHADEKAMARFRETHPEYLHAELDFYTDKDEKKRGAAVASTSCGEAGPSIITIDSYG